ncbi:alkaline phosphatase D family protein [Psychromonas aquatilis]|uniref:Alkaline phosphatase D family protein n=1 Tax=Psychromonas aquatilis TaxID=2005072 RepID=A0ABU9GT79_9GAMM
MKLLLGPLLGIESDTVYTVCFVTPLDCDVAALQLSNGDVINASVITTMYYGKFWRAEIELTAPAQGIVIDYSIQTTSEQLIEDHNNRKAWSFYVPAKNEQPECIYTSCNGFSSPDLINKTSDPYLLWKRIKATHEPRINSVRNNIPVIDAPYSMMMMGGDQLYADSIWNDVAELKQWSAKSLQEKQAKKSSKVLQSQVAKFYEKLYFERWNQPDTSLMLASIPTVMMWDDHDIFDGWGSYPEEIQNWGVHKTIFAQAKYYFELFQIRSLKNKALFNTKAEHYALAFTFRENHILALDNRSQRSLKQVMSEQQWSEVVDYLKQTVNQGNLFILSAVPVVYRDFSVAESYVDTTPWEDELADDLKDHWRAKEHQGERARLIMNLLSNAKKRQQQSTLNKTVIFSGDVHVGCLGVITDKTDSPVTKVHQVVSSGIVHPAPSRLAWLGIVTSTNDRDEYLNEDNSIMAKMLAPIHSDKYIRSRNYVTVSTGTDKKLWINWQTENKDKPIYPIS